MFQNIDVAAFRALYPSQAAELTADMKALYVATVVSGTFDDAAQTTLRSTRVSDFYAAALGGQPVADDDFLVQFDSYIVDDNSLRAQMSDAWVTTWGDKATHGNAYTWYFDQPQGGWCWRSQ